MKLRKFLYLFVFFNLCWHIYGQTVLEKPNLRQSTKIAPLYFGPNAFPIPDMLDGTVSKELRIALAGDHYIGCGDKTTDLFAKITVPLFTDRVNLTVWMPIVEHYTYTEERYNIDSISTMSGKEYGDVYVSTDIQILKQTKRCPDLTLRAAIKSASGGGFYNARYYDGPGYFFDVSIAKSLQFKSDFFNELRLAGSSGFLCWQTDNGRQNDAVMYGVQLKLVTKYFSIAETYGGYSGWEKDGDLPMSLKTNLIGHFGNVEPFFSYQYGLRDFPFQQFQIGVAYKIKVLQ